MRAFGGGGGKRSKNVYDSGNFASGDSYKPNYGGNYQGNFGSPNNFSSMLGRPSGAPAQSTPGNNSPFSMGMGGGMIGGNMGMAQRPMMPSFNPSQFMMQQPQQQQQMQLPDYMQRSGDLSGMQSPMGDMYRQGRFQTMGGGFGGGMGGGMLSNYFGGRSY